MSVLDRDSLAESPLADLHLLANELGLDGFRRLRKADLIDAILVKQGVDVPDAADAVEDADAGADDDTKPRARRGRRGAGRSRVRDEDGATDEDTDVDAAADVDTDTDDDRPAPRARGGRGGRDGGREPRGGRDGGREPRGARDGGREPRGGAEREERSVEGVVELLGNGSGFVRVDHPETSDDDVYISAAQIKRCELVAGDRVGGPVRAPRRSERFSSLVRVETINGEPADAVAGEGTRFEDLSAVFPDERLALGTEDPTVKAIEWLTPFGKGSRVVITGAARAGKSEALRRVAAALAAIEGIELTVVLAGVRPEEIADWSVDGLPAPAGALSFAASGDAQGQAVEQAVEQGRRVAARGGDAVVVIDSLEHVPAASARRVLAAARNIVDGGSLTIVATAPVPLGGETTVIALDATLAAMRRFPALNLGASGTLRPELLVGEAGAEAIAKARADALG